MTDKQITVKKNNFTFQIIDNEIFHRPVGYDFWANEYENSEPFVFKTYDTILNKQKDFLDIGAWLGPNTLYAAKLARKVIAVEPDPVAFSFLKKNIEVNNFNNVSLLEKAFSSKQEVAIQANVNLGDSMTRVVDAPSSNENKVSGISMSQLLDMGDYSLIKIDIEGYESIVIPESENDLREANVPMIISLHTAFNPQKEKGHEDLIASLSNIYNVAYDDCGNAMNVEDLPEGFGCFLLVNEN